MQILLNVTLCSGLTAALLKPCRFATPLQAQ